MRDPRKEPERVGLPSSPLLWEPCAGGPSPPWVRGSLPEGGRRFADLRLGGFRLAGVPACSGAAEIETLVLAGTFVVLFSFQMKEKTTTIKKKNNNQNQTLLLAEEEDAIQLKKQQKKTPALLSAHLEGLGGEWKLEALLSRRRGCNFSCGSGQRLPGAGRRAELSRARPPPAGPRLPTATRVLSL